MTEVTARPVVVVVAALPPPLHGQSTITARVVRALARGSCRLLVVDTSPRSLNRSITYHLRRIAKVSVALLTCLALVGKPRKRLYTVVESGAGIAYNLAIAAVCRLMGIEIFLHHHTARHCKQKVSGVSVLAKIAGPDATHILLSEEMAGDLQLLYPAVKRVMIVQNPIDVPLEASQMQADGGALRLGLLGNLCAEKGLDLAIETCLAARTAGLDVQLVLAGPLAGRSAESSVAAAQARSRDIEYIGPVTGAAKRRFFANIDVFLFPTQYPNEAQPLVILEAMAAGLAIIVNDRGYIGEMLGAAGAKVGSACNYVDTAVEILEVWSSDPSILRREAASCAKRFGEHCVKSNHQFERLISQISRM